MTRAGRHAFEIGSGNEKSSGCIVITGREGLIAAGADIAIVRDKAVVGRLCGDSFHPETDQIHCVVAQTIIALPCRAMPFGGGCELAIDGDFISVPETPSFGPSPRSILGRCRRPLVGTQR